MNESYYGGLEDIRMRCFVIIVAVCVVSFSITDAALSDTKVAEINYTESGKLAEVMHIRNLIEYYILEGIQFRWVHSGYTIEWPYVGESDNGKSFTITDASMPSLPHFIEQLTSSRYFSIEWNPGYICIKPYNWLSCDEPSWVEYGCVVKQFPELSGYKIKRINLIVNDLTISPSWEHSGDFYIPFLLQLWYSFDVTFAIYSEENKLAVSSPSFVFAVPEGGNNPAEQVLGIRNTGGGDMNWVISEDCDWLTVEPKNGTCRDEVDDVNLYVDISGLVGGKYNCQITVTAEDAQYSPQIIDVELNICGELQLSGSGEPNDPYQIGTPDELIYLGQNPCYYDKCFMLTADIDLSEYTFDKAVIAPDEKRGDGYFQGTPFTGVFDGAGNKILNLMIDASVSKNDYLGLFGQISGEQTRVKNLGLENVSVGGGSSSSAIGGLCGENIYCTIRNCHTTGSVSGGSRHPDGLGGLCGNNYEGIIIDCYSACDINGWQRVGGLCGYNWNGTISNSHATGHVEARSSFVGGLCGRNYFGIIVDCYATGSVNGAPGWHQDFGGLCGKNWQGEITNCYATGPVNLPGTLVHGGGLCGINIGKITNCYSEGSVIGGDDSVSLGGLCGDNGGIITDCYSRGSVSWGDGSIQLGGLCGHNGVLIVGCFWDIETSKMATSDGGMGLSTEQMQTMSTFTDAGWDFVGETFNGMEDIWFIGQQDYPHLWWEGMQVPMKLTPVSLNCRSEGNWVKAHITLPEGFTVADVDSNSPAVLHSFGFQSNPPYVFVNKDKLVEIEAAFERQAVCSLAGDWPDELTVAGFLTDGNIFLGTSNVRINHPGMMAIEELASCWLQGDCIYPEIDMNRDSLVNLLDYASLMNINVEFVSE